MTILKYLILASPFLIMLYGIFIPRYNRSVLSRIDSKLVSRAKELNIEKEFSAKNNTENQKTLISEGFFAKDVAKITSAMLLLNMEKSNFFFTPFGGILGGAWFAYDIYGKIYIEPFIGPALFYLISMVSLLFLIILFFRHKKKAVNSNF